MNIHFRHIVLCCLFFSLLVPVAHAQFTVGTTGLMHLPTADMQQDKTFMAGWGWLDTHATPNYEGYGWAQEPTMNYYLNVTILPWLEVSYDCTLIRGKYLWDELGDEHAHEFHKWANQDRNYSIRLRAWKEGWWKRWTPQIVIGANDALHTFKQKGSGQVGLSESGNGFWGRFYVVATKHFVVNYLGTVGVHAAAMYNKREDFRYRGVGAGVNLAFNGMHTGNRSVDRLLNPLDLMVEYDTRTVNVGAHYSIWKDHVNLVCEMNEAKYFSGGVYFKLHLK